MALLAIWPAVDEYSAGSEASNEAAATLAEVRELVAHLSELEKSAEARRTQLAQLKSRAVPESKLHLVRGQVVELARTCGCQVRRVQVGQARQQAWRPGQDPLQSGAKAGEAVEGGLVLAANEVALSITGSLQGAQQFLGRLEALGLLIHPRQLSLGTAEGQEKDVNLELSLWVFDVGQRPAA